MVVHFLSPSRPGDNNMVIGWMLAGLAVGALFAGTCADRSAVLRGTPLALISAHSSARRYGRRFALVIVSLLTVPLTVPHITHSGFLHSSLTFLGYSLFSCGFMGVSYFLVGGLYSFELAHSSIRHYAHLSLILVAMLAFQIVRVVTYQVTER
jgi:hypothetical protein